MRIDENKPDEGAAETQRAQGMAVGLAIGIAAGVALGNLAVGLGVGVALGAGMGAVMARKRDAAADDCDDGDGGRSP